MKPDEVINSLFELNARPGAKARGVHGILSAFFTACAQAPELHQGRELRVVDGIDKISLGASKNETGYHYDNLEIHFMEKANQVVFLTTSYSAGDERKQRDHQPIDLCDFTTDMDAAYAILQRLRRTKDPVNPFFSKFLIAVFQQSPEKLKAGILAPV
jgi:hypothetical protein